MIMMFLILIQGVLSWVPNTLGDDRGFWFGRSLHGDLMFLIVMLNLGNGYFNEGLGALTVNLNHLKFKLINYIISNNVEV